MRQRTRLLSVLLALVMCLGLLPGTVLADDYWPLISITNEAFSPGPGWEIETTPGPTYTITLKVDGPRDFYYEDSHSLRSSHIKVFWTGEGLPAVDPGDVTGTTTVVPGGGDNTWTLTPVPPSDPNDQPYEITGTTTGGANGGQARGRIRMAEDHETKEYDHYTLFRPEDPTRVIDYNFSPWVFKGWLCQETGEMISGDTRADRDMTLVAQWDKSQPETMDKSCGVWFFCNGGRMVPADGMTPYLLGYERIDNQMVIMTVTDTDGSLFAYPTVTREGYTFDGWYTAPEGGTRIEGKQDVSSYVGNHEKKDFNFFVSLFARWSEDKSEGQALRIDFEPDGGKITSIRGVPAAQLAPGTPKASETNTFVDTNSGIGMMMTGGDHKLDSLPEAAREGYTLDGWYTAKEGGSKVTTDTVLSEDCMLFARWVEAAGKDCKVTYDWNGATFIQDIAPQTVACGGQAPLYSISADFGRTLKGWATKDGVLWDNRTMKVTEDMTLYAVWDPAFEDDFDFSNNDEYFDNYHVSDQYLRYLVRNESPYYQKYIRDYSKNTGWGGSCFGMSAVYAMQKGNALDVGVFQSGAKGLRDLEAPNQSNNVRDLVNYYMLAQMTTPGQNAKDAYYREKNISARYSRILSGIQSSGGYALLGFNYASGGGHAVIAKSAGNGWVAIWDPNFPGVDITLTVSGGSAKFSGPSGLSDAFADYNTNTELKYVMPFNTRSQSYDASNLQSVFKSGGDKTADAAQSSRATLTSTVGDFTVAAADGRTAAVKGGEPSGDLVLERVYIDGAEDSVYRYELAAADAENLTVTLTGTDAVVQVVTGDVYARVEAAKLKTVAVSGEEVATSAAAAGKQTITMVSEKLDEKWNSVTVTGSDTGFKVGAAAGQVTISSDNGVSAAVTGENGDTWEEGAPQTITASPEGTVLTTAQLSSGAASTQPADPAAFPFTDVEEGRWFRPFVQAAYEAGLVKGITDTAYGPQNTLSLAEAVTLAARIYAEAHGETAPSGGTPWYKAAYDYCVERGVIDGSAFALEDMTRTATRFEMVAILDGAVPGERMDGSVAVETIPDLAESDAYGEMVYRWYRAGILSGNADGSFTGERSITRAEIAKILCTINRLI